MKNLSKLTDADLLTKGKSTTITTYVFVVLLVVSFVVSVYGYLKNGFTFSTVMPVLVLALLSPNLATQKAIKKEKELRNLN